MEFAEKEHKKLSKKEPINNKKQEPVWFNKVLEKEEIDDKEKDELESLMKEFN